MIAGNKIIITEVNNKKYQVYLNEVGIIIYIDKIEVVAEFEKIRRIFHFTNKEIKFKLLRKYNLKKLLEIL